MSVRIPTLKVAESVIGPAGKWKGRCYEIASMMVDKGLVQGRAVYGHWRGPVSKRSMFAESAVTGFVRHGWVLMHDGSVVDPTRWAFEAKKPYIFHGPSGPEYDEGGNQLRRARLQPPPDYDPFDKHFKITDRIMPTAAWMLVEKLLEIDYGFTEQQIGVLTLEQLHWIANVPVDMLGNQAREVYDGLNKLGQRCLVPIDNWRMTHSEERGPHDV